MTHILHYEEWEDNGKWVCGDVSALSANSNAWWYVPRMLEIPLTEYVKLLIEKFHINYIHYTAKYNVLLFSFSSLDECRKFKNYVNKVAREKKFYIY